MTNAIIEIIAYCVLLPLLVVGISMAYNYVRFCLVKPGDRIHTDPVWDEINEYTYTSTLGVSHVAKKGPFVNAIELENGEILTFWKVYTDLKYSL